MIIEQALIFALGVLTALLIGLMIIPALNRRAMRLARRRIELLLPLSPAEILAGQDQIRAQNALALRQSEQKLEQVQASSAELSGELGRRTAQLVESQNDAASLKTRLHETSTELDQTRLALNDTLAQAAANSLALHDESTRHDRLKQSHSQLRQQHAALADDLDEHKTRLANAELARTAAELQGTEVQRNLDQINLRLTALANEKEVLRDEVQVAQRGASNSARAREKAQEALAAANAELNVLRDQLASAENNRAKLSAELAQLQKLNASLQESYDHQHARHTHFIQEHQMSDNARQQQIETLKAEVAALEGALSTARAHASSARNGKTSADKARAPSNPPAEQHQLTALRETIMDLAATMLRYGANTPTGAQILQNLAQDHETQPEPSLSAPRPLAERILADPQK